jgi:transcription-repair coupling factor (superfamily II helicase)
MHREDNTSVPFPDDSLEQIQFEASFPYNETFDQQKGIEEVKEDMKEPRPMDRLICGDSGYGKTEVALRAAFKAADAGRQVAMLVPTTVLARQHYETFSSRFSLFPYKVEMLSRFRTASESKKILEDLKEGRVDIVIGTHRLLSEDIDFDDLGLLVIDEEQRFGVRQKEKLKFYRKNVDVLTLTATPIPRTLYMSLSGIQDISVINTPPEERVAIETEVGPFEPQEAKQALERELSRGGQVFWVYNRVKKIKQITDYVRSLLPEARIAYGHGQMSKGDLKQVMNSFYAGEIDILVCTTIIEAGLDCPNANTMIIQNAHRFGLAQLYQLRGRIGRSHEQAYAYFFYPPKTKITEETEARLSTIKECSELGSGFRLAMRDLEIRGAGNLLGKNQHGNIRAVGFPLYCRLLQRSIRRLREGFEEPEPLPRLKLPGNYYIPHEYIPDEKQITGQYQELASSRKIQEVHDLARRWKETFGPIPKPAKMLLKRHIFKIMAVKNGWNDFRYQNQRLNMRFTKEPPTQLLKAAQKANARPSTRSNRLFIEKLTPKKIEQWLTHTGITLNP